MQPLAFIPSPSQGVWHLGPVPIRAYAIMIIIGIVVAVWLGERRWAAKGGAPGVVIDVAVWAVPFGLVGGRLYHVATDYQRYFGDGRDPVNALKIWEGGLGIWGAVLLGALGAVIGCRRRGISVLALGDAVAPGIALAQGVGRWGNYWNQELYGRPLHTSWALKIDQAHRPRLSDGSLDPKYADVATYHPAFLYESLWCIGVAILVLWADRRFTLTHGRAFALYVAAYTVGRFWIEALRIDDAHHILGLRLNDWTSIIVFLGAVGYLYWSRNITGPENVGRPQPAVESEPGEKADAPGSVTTVESPAVASEDGEGQPEDAPAPTTEAEPEPEEAAEAEAAPEAEAEAEPDAEQEAEPEAAAEAEPEEQPETEDTPAPAAETEDESAAEPEESEDEPAPNAEAQAQDAPEPEPEPEPEVKNVTAPEADVEENTEDREDDEPAPEASVEQDAGAGKDPEGESAGATADNESDAKTDNENDRSGDVAERAARGEPVRDGK